MVGFITLVVIVLAVGAALALSLAAQLRAATKRVGAAVTKQLGVDGPSRPPAVLSTSREVTKELRRALDRSRLDNGRYLGGTYIAWVRPEEWKTLAGRVDLVTEEIIASVLADTGLDPSLLSVTLKCKADVEDPVRVEEVFFPPITSPLEPITRADRSQQADAPVPGTEAAPRLVLLDERGKQLAGLPADVPVYVGRATSCDLTIKDQKVSEHHCCLTARDGDAELLDLGSRNGTFVNEVPIDGAARVFPGDVVRAGLTRMIVADTDLEASALPTVDAVMKAAVPPFIDAPAAPDPAVGNPGPVAATAPRGLQVLDLLEEGPPDLLARRAAQVNIRTEPSPVAERPRIDATRTDPVVLGWHRGGVPVLYDALTDPTQAGNGHLAVYGASGMGKTELLRSIISQSITRGMTACVLDQAGGFRGLPDMAIARPWVGMRGNPLCPTTADSAAVARTKLEVIDAIATAVRSQNNRLGHRQQAKLLDALDTAFDEAEAEGRWATMHDLHPLLDADLRGVIGELTRRDLFNGGGPLGDVLVSNTVVDLSDIPGVGTLQLLITGLVAAAIDLRVAALPPTPGEVRHLLVIDEANRLSRFSAVERMLREGRVAGVAVAVASQHPQDLPGIAHAVAGTVLCLRLGAKAAQIAAGHLDPSDATLAERICRLPAGEAFVQIAGQKPVRVRLAQQHRDASHLAAPPAASEPSGARP